MIFIFNLPFTMPCILEPFKIHSAEIPQTKDKTARPLKRLQSENVAGGRKRKTKKDPRLFWVWVPFFFDNFRQFSTSQGGILAGWRFSEVLELVPDLEKIQPRTP